MDGQIGPCQVRLCLLLVFLSAALHAALLEEPNAERVRSEPVHELAWKNGCLISFPHGCSRAAWFEDLVGVIREV